MLGKVSTGLGPGPWGSCGFRPGALNFLVTCPKAALFSVCNVLETHCVPLAQHCLISFHSWLHCSIISADSVPFLLWKECTRCCIFLSLLGIDIACARPPNSKLICLLIFYPLVLSLRILSVKNSLLVQVTYTPCVSLAYSWCLMLIDRTAKRKQEAVPSPFCPLFTPDFYFVLRV